MLMNYAIITIMAIVVLGALNGGQNIGDTIRRGVKTLLVLIGVLIILGYLYDSWPVVLEWIEAQVSALKDDSRLGDGK